MERLRQENDGMRFSVEMERILSGQNRRILKIQNQNGSSVENLLIGQTLENPFSIGNSVVPVMAKALVEENCPYLKVGERVPNMKINKNSYQLKFA